jgi:hypothetical protein
MAIVPTNNPRELPWPAVAYISRRIAFNTPGIASPQTVEVGSLPGGAIVIGAWARVHTVFNAATTNVVIVGTDTGSEFFDAATAGSSITESSATMQASAAAVGYVVPDGGAVVYVNYTQTGGAATTGAATIIVMYITRVG